MGSGFGEAVAERTVRALGIGALVLLSLGVIAGIAIGHTIK